MTLLSSCATASPALSAARAELAPTGTLRAGINYGNVILADKDEKSRELRGVHVDLVREVPEAMKPRTVKIGSVEPQSQPQVTEQKAA